MKAAGGSDAQKRRAGEAAVDAVSDGMVVGLGTGSTAAHAIRALGRAVDAGLDVRGVPTSFQSRRLALEVGVPLTDLDAVDGLDVAIDGADQVVDDGAVLVKGGGAAHTREKLVAASAARYVVVADPTKLADGVTHAVPVSVVPEAWTLVADRVEAMGGEPSLREAAHKDGPVVTDEGDLVLDCAFGADEDPAALARRLSSVPGVVEHGLFVDVADEVLVGTDDGVDVLEP
jgi:ribose 5-phosphate isomerase A